MSMECIKLSPDLGVILQTKNRKFLFPFSLRGHSSGICFPGIHLVGVTGVGDNSAKKGQKRQKPIA